MKDEINLTQTQETNDQILDSISEKKKVSLPPISKKKNNSVLDATFEPTSPISPVGQSFALPISQKNGKKKTDHLEAFNPVITSKQILEDCNCVSKPNPKIAKLRKGEGKLISTGSKSIKEVYSYIFNKSQ